MWCAMHVKNGSEARTEAFVSGLLPDGLNARCFHLTRHRRKKYGGQWQTVQESLLPGYVFIDTDQPEAVNRELRRTPHQGMLFSSDTFVSALQKQETDFIESIMDQDGEIGLSKVSVDDNGDIRFLSGPLLNVHHFVRKVNLHQRIAEVETEFLGEKHVFYLGIEIAGKTFTGETADSSQ